MAVKHSSRFLKLVDETKARIRELTVDQVKTKLERRESFLVVDVREESEWAKDHLPGAVHLGKGIIERDIEERVPDTGAEIVLYCGGGFLGTGGRCQEHINIVNKFKKENRGAEPVAVCDVWDGNKEVGRGLYFSAEKCGLKDKDTEHVTKDYRKILDLKEVDVVCIATPDHWHAKMSIDAAAAGKDATT